MIATGHRTTLLRRQQSRTLTSSNVNLRNATGTASHARRLKVAPVQRCSHPSATSALGRSYAALSSITIKEAAAIGAAAQPTRTGAPQLSVQASSQTVSQSVSQACVASLWTEPLHPVSSPSPCTQAAWVRLHGVASDMRCARITEDAQEGNHPLCIH